MINLKHKYSLSDAIGAGYLRFFKFHTQFNRMYAESGYNVLDGKQRTLTLCSFVEGGFALPNKIRVKEIDGIQLVDMTFSSLPEEIKARILEYELSIAILRSLDAEERATVFFMRNQAVSLTKMDLSVVVLGEKAMNAFTNLCAHNFMQEKIKLTEPARRKHFDLQILLQYLILCQRPGAGFSGTEIMSFCDDIKNGEASIDEEETVRLLNYLDNAFKAKRQYLKKMHIPVALYVARTAMQQNIAPEIFCVMLDDFFDALPENKEYMDACKSGSSKRSNIQLRLQGMSGILEDAEKYSNRATSAGDQATKDEADAAAVSDKPKRGRRKKV